MVKKNIYAEIIADFSYRFQDDALGDDEIFETMLDETLCPDSRIWEEVRRTLGERVANSKLRLETVTKVPERELPAWVARVNNAFEILNIALSHWIPGLIIPLLELVLFFTGDLARETFALHPVAISVFNILSVLWIAVYYPLVEKGTREYRRAFVRGETVQAPGENSKKLWREYIYYKKALEALDKKMAS